MASFSKLANPETSPLPLLSSFDQIGAQRIAFNLADNLTEVIIGVDHERLEAA